MIQMPNERSTDMTYVVKIEGTSQAKGNRWTWFYGKGWTASCESPESKRIDRFERKSDAKRFITKAKKSESNPTVTYEIIELA